MKNLAQIICSPVPGLAGLYIMHEHNTGFGAGCAAAGIILTLLLAIPAQMKGAIEEAKDAWSAYNNPTKPCS